ncbi:MAG: hypothetical protein R3F56_06390 [Planctomycetota bacterium]
MRTRDLVFAILASAPFGVAQLPVWQQKFPPSTPGGLLAMSYDDVGQRTLGIDYDTSNRIRVWTWSGTTWNVRATQGGPTSGSSSVTACFDSRRAVLVMVRFTGATIETWELAGTDTWTRTFPTGAPSLGVDRMSLHYSRAGAVSILVGQASTSAPVAVYHYSPSSWQLRSTTGAPTAGAGNTAYDTRRDRIVLFSGTSTVADTWEFDGVSWTRQQPANSPPARVSTAMAFDPTRGRCVLQGGNVGNPFTWEWDGSNWQINLAAPPAAQNGRMAHDALRGRMVFVGVGGPLETWEYFVPRQATHVPFGTACAGSGGLPTLAASAGSLPWLGETLTCTLTNLPTSPLSVPFGLLGSSTQTWLGVPLPFDMGVFGATGCTLYTSVEVSVQLANAGGTAQWQVAIPATVALRGAFFYQQALVLDPSANRFGATLTNAARAVIGDR